MKKLITYTLIFITLLILMTSVSATENTTTTGSADCKTTEIENLEIENTNQTNNLITANNHKNQEGHIEFEKDNYQIKENESNLKIKGTINYYGGYNTPAPYFTILNLNCTYIDGNNILRNYTIHANDGKFEFNLNQCEGLLSSNSPYNLTFSPINDTYYEIFLEENDDYPLVKSWITITVTTSQNITLPMIYVGPNGVDSEGYGSKNNPYKSIKYAISKANENECIYIYEGRYDENSISLTKSLSIIGENKNVIITSTQNNRNVFEAPYSEGKNDISLRFENLTFDSVKSGTYNAILYLRNTVKTEIINCAFINNDGERNIWCSSENTEIKNCEFTDCAYTTAGDLIYLTGKGNPIITNITFNKIANMGNGVLILIEVRNSPTNLNITDITVKNSNGIIIGIEDGGSQNKSNTINIKNATFENNNFKKSGTNKGGQLIYVGSNSKMEILNSKIINNTVAFGLISGGNNGSEIKANYNLIYNNTGKILHSVLANKPVTKYNMDYNYWGSENPEFDDITVNIIATNKELNETKTITHKNNPTINISILNSTIYEGDNVTVNITLNNDATGNITISGINVDSKEVKNGNVIFTISNLPANQYSLTLNYSGDENYNEMTQEFSFIVKGKLDPEININSVEIYEGEIANLTIRLNENATGNLSIFINNKLFTEVNINTNVLNLNLKNLTTGEYNITIIYSGDKEFENASANAIVNVKKIKLNITEEYKNVSISNSIVNKTQITKITVNLPENATGTITFYINGGEHVFVENLTKGIATLSLKYGVGLYNISTVYSGDENYNPYISQNKTFNITKANISYDEAISNSSIINKSITYTIQLGNTATGNLTVNVDGINHTQSLENGSATLTINDLSYGTHKFIIIYTGDENYTAIYKNTTITLTQPKTVKLSKIIGKNKSFKASKKVKKYTILLKSDNIPIKNVKVTLKIKGKTYLATTNNKGKATFKIKLNKKGKYKSKINFKGNANYKSSNKTVKIIIK